MPQVLWDASGLIKRYAQEMGSDSADALFNFTPLLPMVVTYLGYAETNASLRRKVNRGSINMDAYRIARSSVRTEVQTHPDFKVLSISDEDILAGISLTDRYNLNASDASILTAYLRYAFAIADTCVLVASDMRLLRAASAEGLQTLNPERTPAADIPLFLASL